MRRLFEKVEHIEQLLLRQEPQPDEDRELMDIGEAAAFLKVSVAALYTKVSRKEIPYSKPGKRLYFNRSELRAWIGDHKRRTVAEMMAERQAAQKKWRR